MRRDPTLDTLRGLMLVIMAVDHFGGPLAKHTWQTFGFVSAAEGFVFLSGLVTGRVYSRYAAGGRKALFNRAFKRASTIYTWHCSLILILFALTKYAGTYSNGMQRLAPAFAIAPLHGLVRGLLLVYQPTWFDILPLYVVFLGITPFIIMQLERGAALVLTLSATVWLFFQSDIRILLINVPVLSEMSQWYFNVFAWQLLFVFGVWLGRKPGHGRRPAYASWPLLATAMLGAAVLYLIRHHILTVPGLDIPEATSVENLGWLRVLNFSVMCYLVGWLRKEGKKRLELSWLAFLGRHSLQVFSYHVLVLLLLHPVRATIADSGSGLETMFCLSFVCSLTLPAFLHRRVRLAGRNRSGQALPEEVIGA